MTYSDRLEAETDFIALFDRDRALGSGVLSPRQRIDRLVDPESWLELGRLARSQQPGDVDDTPADGLITGWCRVGGRLAVVMAEDPLAAARSDGQVAENKRQRLLATAHRRGAALIVMIDGNAGKTPSDAMEGMLFGHLADTAPTTLLPHPAIALVFGPAEGWSALALAEADVVIESRAAPIPGVDADASAADDATALDLAKEVLAIVTHRDIPVVAPIGGSVSDLPEFPLTAEAVIDTVADPGPTVWLGDGPSVRTGLCRIGGYPVAFTTGVSNMGLVAADLAAIHGLVRAANNLGVAILMVQDTCGYDPELRNSPECARELSGLVRKMRSTRVPKLVLIAGRGQVLGTFALGGRGLGVDYIVTWPWADVAVHEGDAVTEGPFAAAGMGLVDDVLTPSETAGRLGCILDILDPVHRLTTPEEDRKGRVVAEISKV
jgi:acetyl-CoA carboxylase carboxyltransferase component